MGKVYSINEIYSIQEMHLEKLLLIGSTEYGLAKFRSSWIGSNNFSFKEPHPQNTIIDSNVGVISTEKLFEVEPTYNYADDLASRDAQPLAEVGTWSIHDPMVVQPVEVSMILRVHAVDSTVDPTTRGLHGRPHHPCFHVSITNMKFQ